MQISKRGVEICESVVNVLRRQWLDITGNGLAELAGVSRGTVTAVKSGKSCSAQTANKLAAILGHEIIERGAYRDTVSENS